MPKVKDKDSGWVARANGKLKPEELIGPEERTNDVSVTWGNTRAAAVGNLTATGLAGPFHAAEVKKIIQKKGRVMPSPLTNNPNHCNLFGVSKADFYNLFS